MPGDPANANNNNNPSSRTPRFNKNLSSKMRRSRSGADGHTRSVELDGEIVLPRRIRARLEDAYNQIEREFELLYAENIALREELKSLHDRLDGDKGESSETADGLGTPGIKPVTAKKSGSQISQRIKTTYKASTSKIVSSFKTPQPQSQHVREYRGHRDGVWEVQVSQCGPQIIGTASADHTARMYCIETGTCVLQYTGHAGSVNSIRFHPTQDLVLTASGDQSIHIWRPQICLQSTIDQLKSQSSGEDDQEALAEREEGADTTDADQSHEPLIVRQPIVELAGHTAVVIAADWLSGGSHVISASWDRTANLYDSESGVVVNTLQGHDSELTNVYAHTSQKLVVTSSKDATFRLWDLRTPMQVNVFQGHTQTVTSAVFAGVDKVVSGSDDRCVKVWDLKNMQSPIVTIRTDSAVNRLSVSSSSQNIAIPHDNRNIRIHDIHGQRLGRLSRSNRQGHTRMVCGASWCEDNSHCNLFTCGFDRQVIGWNFKE